MLLKFKTSFNRLRFRVDPTSLKRASPISTNFGIDRGKPIDRFYIEKFLSSNVPRGLRGAGIEVGSTEYLEMYGDSLISKTKLLYSDSYLEDETSLYCDLSKPESVPSAKFDLFICTQTVNFVYDFNSFFASCYKMLKPGGILVCTAAGITQISRYDMDRWGDYWRFTSMSLRKTLETHFESQNIRIESFGNVSSCIALLQGLSVEDFKDTSILQNHDKNYELLVTAVAKK